MWKWLLGNKRSVPHPCNDPSDRKLPAVSANLASNGTLSELVEEMRAKGYQGPFAHLRDGLLAMVFHGPGVSVNPEWIEPDGNPFQMRVVNCDLYCQQSQVFAIGESASAIEEHFQQARQDPHSCCENRETTGMRRMPCLLGYPLDTGRLTDGAQFVAETMEDPWNIFLFDDYLHFTRSWTGQMRYRARLMFRESAVFVTEVEMFPAPASPGSWPDLWSGMEDEGLPIRQVDFLIKALLYRCESPAPIPHSLDEETGRIALHSLTEYGRWGSFPSFEETTEYRTCLNGVRGRFPPSASNALLPLIKAVEECGSISTRQRLLDALGKYPLFLAFSLGEDALKSRTIAEDTVTEFATHEWHGVPCVFAYTDPAFRVESSHGCVLIEAVGLWKHVQRFRNCTNLVINPGGPATCTLELAELKALAD